MEITGRLTADATVSKVKGDKKVVNFTLAVNDTYRTRSGEKKTVTEFVRCAYWLSDKVAQFLTKGKVISLYGRISARAWSNREGEPKAELNFHTSEIKFLGGAGSTKRDVSEFMQEKVDDLPF